MNTIKKIGIMQPYFFPYLGYFQLINETERFVIYDRASFRKKSWITRNRILDKGNGQPIYIRVPLKKMSSNKMISELTIDNSQLWRDKILNLLFFNYKKSNFFEVTYEYFKDWVYTDCENLHQYNSEITKKICACLEIKTEIISDNNYADEIENHLTNHSEQNNLPVKTQRILDLCNHHEFSTYLNPIGGTDLYDRSDFSKLGYELNFIQTAPFEYNQFNHPFVSHLSIVDVMFHNGIEKTSSLLNHFKIL